MFMWAKSMPQSESAPKLCHLIEHTSTNMETKSAKDGYQASYLKTSMGNQVDVDTHM